ncbi:hypothetical protein OG911_28095 [Streptomyces sp. NBC_00208]|uniref:hypothetical protein n=1 Tax=Streptomyces sp. NBC_00208 TaxID=2975681 RepID=UPI002E2BC13E|nr:hypothetical protein [Streptomyces sp. NBC_00208]
MANEPKEVKRLMEAIDALEAMEDDAACTAAVSEALRKWPSTHARLRELRQSRVQALRNQNKTWPEIAAIIGDVTAARAQQIGAGLRGSKRPPKKTDDE